MKVIQSTLGMEAFSSYRDVRLAGAAANDRKVGSSPLAVDQQFRLNLTGDPPENDADTESGRSSNTTSQPATTTSSFLQLSSFEVRVESASLTYLSTGNVVTGDGRELDFSLDLSVERASIYAQIDLDGPGYLMDPLVLSFSDGLSSLSGASFAFDLDADGSVDNIGALAGGSGFLVLDINGDGQVNDGRELFGPVSGDGYGDLAKYDLDGNLWIDENDAVFDKLLLWMGAGGADSSLVTLREAGVGAICLTSAESDFTVKNSSGEVLGKIARAGLFLMEDGQPKSMQEIDLSLEVREELADTSTELTAINDVVTMLRQLISIRRRQIHQMLQRRGVTLAEDQDSRDDRLSEKFWEWQRRRTA